MTERSIEDSVEIVAQPWIGSAYYADAEKWTFLFWSDESPFRRYFDQLDLGVVIELACGHGRHAELIQHKVYKLYLLDVLDENIAFCKNRRSKNQRIEFIKNSGYTFQPIEANSVRGGPGCLNRFSASISGASAGVRLPCGVAAG